MRYLVTSDIHLGHPTTPTEHIAESFRRSILTPENAAKTDVLFINGDLFDRLLSLNTTEAQQAVRFCSYLLHWCQENSVLLRVLLGTPSHDWDQSSILIKLNDARTRKADLKYHRTLEIEHFPQFNKHVLYIPDEWVNSQAQLETQIQAKLQEHHLSQVDMAMLHGQFNYQMAGVPHQSFCYDEAYFHSLVRELIHIGHFHVYSRLERIVANGSLERLSHGEEGEKGYIHVENATPVFHPNPQAYTYTTVRLTPKYDFKRLDKNIAKYREGSHIRLTGPDDHPLLTVFHELQGRYPAYRLKKKSDKDTSGESSVTYIYSDKDIALTKNLVLESSIYDTLTARLRAKHQFTTRQEEVLLSHMELFRFGQPPGALSP